MQESAKVTFIRPHTPKRLRGLDALRGLAAMAVVLFQYTTGYEAQFGRYASRPYFYFPDGHFGVELFFCISGFVILGTIERTANFKRFAVARFARIYPAYFVCATISFAATLAARFRNATIPTGLSGAPAIDPSYWALSYELFFYAAAATVWSLMRGKRRMERPCLVWLACSLVGHLSPWVGRHHRLSSFLNIEYANLFVAGMMLYYISRKSRSRLTTPTLCVSLLMALFPPEFNSGHMPQPFYVAMIVTFCAAIWIVADSSGRFLDIRPLVFLGEISYSLYLIHQIVGYAIIRILLGAGVGTNVAILLTISLMVGVAFCLRTVVERPAERWIKGFGKPKAGDSTASRPAAAYSVARMRA